MLRFEFKCQTLIRKLGVSPRSTLDDSALKCTAALLLSPFQCLCFLSNCWLNRVHERLWTANYAHKFCHSCACYYANELRCQQVLRTFVAACQITVLILANSSVLCFISFLWSLVILSAHFSYFILIYQLLTMHMYIYKSVCMYVCASMSSGGSVPSIN